MTQFEHSPILNERMQYKNFLQAAIRRVEADIKRMKESAPGFIRKPWPDNSNSEFVELDNKITNLTDGIQQEENAHMLPIQERYLKILKKKYAEYQTHFQKPIYKCFTCGETDCVCKSVFPEPEEKVFEDKVNKLF